MPRRRAHLRLAAAVALAAVASLAGTTSARAAEPGVVPDLNWGISPAEQDRVGAVLRDMGAKWVRLHVQWKNFEPAVPGSYNLWWFDHTDRSISVARAAGAKVILMVYDAPVWASGSASRNTPRDAADYANFLRVVATRYQGQVAAYEIWNEQNTDRFWTGSSAAEYTQLLKQSYAAVKGVDAQAKVVFGGLSTNDYAYVEAAYAAGAQGSFDAMVVHPYGYCGSEAPDVLRRGGNGRLARDSFLGYREVRASMLARGDDKPIWITEFGWTTTTHACNPSAGVWQGGVTEAVQAAYMTKAFALFDQDPYVQVAVSYNLRNNYWANDADDSEARFGLLRADFSPKPAYDAFKRYATGVAAPPPPPPASGDTTAPETKIDSGPTGTTTATSASFGFSADETATFECSLDGAAYAACASPSAVGPVALGAHTFRVRAKDAAGNVDASPAERAWVVTAAAPPVRVTPPLAPTNQPPTVHVTSPLQGASFSRHLTLTAKASDDKRVTKVDFWLNDKLVATDHTAPYSATYSLKKGYYGTYWISAVAHDADSTAAKSVVTVTRRR